MVYKAEVVNTVKCELGEGPCWDEQFQRLFWIDIIGKKLHCYEPPVGTTKSWDLPQMVGTVAPYTKEEVVVALEDGVYIFGLTDSSLTEVCPIERDILTNRTNDGKCDPRGRFWVGTMPIAERGSTGAFYRIANGEAAKVRDNVSCSNGLAFDEAKGVMYYIDTPLRRVDVYDYDVESGEVSNPRVALEIPQGIGGPDGMTIDNEGMLWVALWGGYSVRRYNPATGEELAKVETPAFATSACTFGGADLKTLYITTAQKGSENVSEAGMLFSVNLPVGGKGSYRFVDNLA